jgi:hypothetical protein
MWRFWISVVAPLALAACVDASNDAPHPPPGLRPAVLTRVDGLPPPTQCALFAREFTGIHIRGDAWSWWDLAAQNDYPRRDAPHPNTIIVLRSTPQLPLGHVGIVKRIVGPREITITHANWGMDDPTKRIVHDSTAVVDVSPNNDWTQVRLWNAPAHAFGKVYFAYGFIYPHSFTAEGDALW